MKTISHLMTILQTAGAFLLCLTVAGLGLYLFEEEEPGLAGVRNNRTGRRSGK
jgi:hypothetical protein